MFYLTDNVEVIPISNEEFLVRGYGKDLHFTWSIWKHKSVNSLMEYVLKSPDTFAALKKDLQRELQWRRTKK